MRGYVGNVEEETLQNSYFRKVLYTGKHSQLVVMSLAPGEDIGLEVHEKVDQFFRIEKGSAKVVIDGEEQVVGADFAVIVPAGSEHNLVNVSKGQDLKLYTVYSPPNHPEGTVHKTKAEAEAAEAAEHH